MTDLIPNGYAIADSVITSTTPGEVIQNLVIKTTGDQPAISVTSDDVTIKNVLIETTTGDGIDVYGNNASISNLEVDGPTPTDNSGSGSGGNTGIYSYGVSGLEVTNATFRNTGTGVAAIQSPGTVLTGITGYNMQGPFPGGQLVQFGSSDGSSLTNFAVHNDVGLSHPEDDISVVSSRNTAISQGVVDGDNSPSGVGVMVEGQSDGTTVSKVDALHMGDGAFSSYSNDVDFNDVRSFANIAGDQGRGRPLSNGLIFYAEGSDVSFDNASYTDPGNPNNIFSGNGSTQADISDAPGAVPMTPITDVLAWTPSDLGGSASTSATTSSRDTATATTSGQTLTSTYQDVFDANGQADTRFVFNPGYGHDVVNGFQVGDAGSDVLALPASDFSSIAAVLHDTHTSLGSAVITDPRSGDTIQLTGVTKSDLKANPSGIELYA